MASSMNSLSSTTVASSAQNPNPDLATAADLPTTISILSSLVSFADTTLASVSSLLSASPSSNPAFSQCPFDSRHRMPPEFLFIHSLRCPSAPAAARTGPDFPEYFHYTRSLKSETEVRKESGFIRSLVDPEEELFFSIDREFTNFGVGSAFIYRDCPGVVSFPEVDEAGRNFTLPGILAVECANFSGGLDPEDVISVGEGGGIMPSGLWELRREVCSWKDFPRSYSHVVLRVLCRLDRVGNEALSKWVIANSPCYGILIDVPIRDHIFLLLKLCLKVMWREGCRSMKFTFERRDQPSTWATVDCPCLYRSMTWLASQLSILYGEVNGKLFVIDMLKESLIQTGTGSLFPVDGNSCKAETLIQSTSNSIEVDGGRKLEVTGDGDGMKSSGSTCFRQVFVSQIAAAIAALHERFLIESRINNSHFFQALPTYQRSSEYSYRSTRAIEERAKRPNYRSLLEHDGLLLQQSHQQGQDKPKTKDELLAEERDYKRRRMSYRGKKDKRTPSQVLHNIIEGHMEEIRQAGGIGCNLNDVTDSFKLPYARHSGVPRLAEGNYKNSMSNISCYSRRVPLKPQSRTEGKYKIYVHGDERGTEYGSKSPSYCSCDKSSFSVESQKQGVRNSVNSNSCHSCGPRDEKKESYLPSTYYEKLSEHNASSSVRSHINDRSNKYHRLGSVTQNAFEDRYDPSGSYD